MSVSEFENQTLTKHVYARVSGMMVRVCGDAAVNWAKDLIATSDCDKPRVRLTGPGSMLIGATDGEEITP